MNTYKVVVGPYRVAQRYAQRAGWLEDDVVIITRGHQLAAMDPALISQIVTVKLHALGKRVADDLAEETARITSLWPVNVQVAA